MLPMIHLSSNCWTGPFFFVMLFAFGGMAVLGKTVYWPLETKFPLKILG